MQWSKTSKHKNINALKKELEDLVAACLDVHMFLWMLAARGSSMNFGLQRHSPPRTSRAGVGPGYILMTYLRQDPAAIWDRWWTRSLMSLFPIHLLCLGGVAVALTQEEQSGLGELTERDKKLKAMAEQLIQCRAAAQKVAIPTPCRGKPSAEKVEKSDGESAMTPSVEHGNPKVLPDFVAWLDECFPRIGAKMLVYIT